MASRQSTAPSSSSRPLTLPEELEKLEQSITLTLQEIDANFSRAHRIVTSSIIPVVEQYGQHSDAVWQGSKFWKEFFEASANISLTGYEEPDATDAGEETEVGRDEGETLESEVTERPRSRATDEFGEETTAGIEASSLMDSPSMSVKAAAHGTPKTAQRQKQKGRVKEEETEDSSSFADYPSPYEQLRREMAGESTAKQPATPGTAYTSRPSPFKATAERRQPTGNADPLLHRVLDRNYRIGATPRTTQRTRFGISKPSAAAAEDTRAQPTRTLNPALDSSPFSPALEAPQLRAEIFGTPADAKRRKAKGAPSPSKVRTPGVSVQRPVTQSGFTPDNDRLGTTRKTLFTGGKDRNNEQTEFDKRDELYLSDSDDDSAPFGGMSPPKTIAFNMPQSRLLQTPAKEASRRMVDDLLLTAGAGSVTDDMTGDAPATRAFNGELDDSPSIVRVERPDLPDDTF